jgi:hypothetical protein
VEEVHLVVNNEDTRREVLVRKGLLLSREHR